jgi:hypothetical protein
LLVVLVGTTDLVDLITLPVKRKSHKRDIDYTITSIWMQYWMMEAGSVVTISTLSLNFPAKTTGLSV